MKESLTGLLERVTFRNSENGFTVAKLNCPERNELVCLVGTLPTTQPGETIRCIGRWERHPQHGMQFLVDEAHIELPATAAGIQKYLSSGLVKGIGPVFAEKIVSHFGVETLSIIETAPNRLFEIPGIGKTRVAKIRSCWEEQKAIRQVMVFLQTVGVTPGFAERIFKAYGNDSIPKVRENPFLLAQEVKGIGFRTADTIAKKMGISPDHPGRIEAGVEHVLSELADEGHVCFPKSELIGLTVEMLEAGSEAVELAIERLGTKKRLHEEPSQSATYVFRRALYLTEMGIAREIERLLREPSRQRPLNTSRALEWVQERLNLRLAPRQMEAVAAAISSKLLVITGGPGTGKSTITRAILSIIQNVTRRMLLAAPTGRAAKRLSEITRRNASTIHSLLEWDFKQGGFKRGRDKPLLCDLLVIDEASMIDTVLMFSLLRAVPDHAKLILVGDVDQLPSVGPGNVLQDLITSGQVPVVQLTDIFRQAAGSKIIVNAHRIKEGEFPFIHPAPRSDFFFLEEEDPEKLQAVLVDLVKSRLPKKYRFDPLRDIQVLTPMKRGIIGTSGLNAALQTALNPRGPSLLRFGTCYRQGDKVMQIKNNYDKEVFNGDVGRIERIDLEGERLFVTFDERLVEYSLVDLEELSLAYAVSVHKFQGSECPCVIMPVHTTHFKLLHRNLLYTGVTRGRRLVVLVGTKKALAIAISNQEATTRHTGLKRRLSDLQERGQTPPSECRDRH